MLLESIKKISENLTKLREEINRTQRHLLKNVSFGGGAHIANFDVTKTPLCRHIPSMTSTWDVFLEDNC